MLTIDSRPDFVPHDEWLVLLERTKEFRGGYNAYAVEDLDAVFLVGWDFSLHRWDPGARAFAPVRRIEAGD